MKSLEFKEEEENLTKPKKRYKNSLPRLNSFCICCLYKMSKNRVRERERKKSKKLQLFFGKKKVNKQTNKHNILLYIEQKCNILLKFFSC